MPARLSGAPSNSLPTCRRESRDLRADGAAPAVVDPPGIVGGQAELRVPANRRETLAGFDDINQLRSPSVRQIGSAAAKPAVDLARTGIQGGFTGVGDAVDHPAAVPGIVLRPG